MKGGGLTAQEQRLLDAYNARAFPGRRATYHESSGQVHIGSLRFAREHGLAVLAMRTSGIGARS